MRGIKWTEEEELVVADALEKAAKDNDHPPSTVLRDALRQMRADGLKRSNNAIYERLCRTTGGSSTLPQQISAKLSEERFKGVVSAFYAVARVQPRRRRQAREQAAWVAAQGAGNEGKPATTTTEAPHVVRQWRHGGTPESVATDAPETPVVASQEPAPPVSAPALPQLPMLPAPALVQPVLPPILPLDMRPAVTENTSARSLSAPATLARISFVLGGVEQKVLQPEEALAWIRSLVQ